MRSWLIRLAIGISLLMGLLGCGDDRALQTISGYALDVTMPASGSDPISISIADLLATPPTPGQLIRVSGQFEPQPILVCDGLARYSPAQWQLKNGGGAIFAGSDNDDFLALAPPGLTITVEGRWRFWRGYVGCGKDEMLRELYYLAVTKFLAPNPLTNATLTPAGIAQITPTSPPLPTPTSPQTPIPLTQAPSLTPIPAMTATQIPPTQLASPTSPAVPAQTATTQLTVTPSPTLTQSPAVETTATQILTATATPMGEFTATPTVDINSSPTPTAVPQQTPAESATPTQTLTPTPISTISGELTPTPDPRLMYVGNIVSQDLVMESIERDQIHLWLYEVESSDVLTINVASPISTNMVITVQEPDGDEILTQNNAQLGQPEIVKSVNMPDPGVYRILITEAEGDAGTYSMIVQGQGAYAFIFRGTIGYNDSASSSLAESNDHFWHFDGDAGDVITMRVTPTDQSDLFMELYGPDAAKLNENNIDDGGAGDEEVFEFTLPASGIYAIRVGEFHYHPANYNISLTKN